MPEALRLKVLKFTPPSATVAPRGALRPLVRWVKLTARTN
jgi:hypothetical protein